MQRAVARVRRGPGDGPRDIGRAPAESAGHAHESREEIPR